MDDTYTIVDLRLRFSKHLTNEQLDELRKVEKYVLDYSEIQPWWNRSGASE